MKQKKQSALKHQMKKVVVSALTFIPMFLHAATDQNQDPYQGTLHEQASITPTVGFRHASRPAVIVDAEFLWWHGEISNLSYAIKREVVPTGSAFIPGQIAIAPKGKEEFEGNWDPGVRLGLGVITNLDGWDLYMNWTYYHTNAHESKNVAPIDVPSLSIVGTKMYTSPWLIQPNSVFYNNISGRWSLAINVIDLELGRNFWISDELSLRPMSGIRGFWSNLDFKVHANRPLTTGVGPSNERSKYDQDSWGVGLLTGFGTNWHLTRIFSIYGDLELALTYGKQDIRRDASIENYTALGPNIIYSAVTHDHRYALQPFIDIGMGIRFENTFDTIRAMLDFGWEFHSLLKFNQLFRGTRGQLNDNDNNLTVSDYPSTNGNLSLSGLVLRGRLEF